MGDHRMDIPAGDAAKAVMRVLPHPKNEGETVEQAIKANEVLAAAVRDGELTVVTIHGEKLLGKAPKAAK